MAWRVVMQGRHAQLVARPSCSITAQLAAFFDAARC
jgi:hypothetical protein